MVKIFNANDSAEQILEEVKSNGIAGISGGRLETRAKRAEVNSLAEETGYEDLRNNNTSNHPSTELAYPHDSEKYSDDEAQKLVENAFDKLNGDDYF